MSLQQLVIRYGLNPYEHGDKILAPRLPTSRDLRGMGPLVWIEMERFDGIRENWFFDPFPRLAYDDKTNQLWILGGRYRLDDHGFHNVDSHGAAQPLTERDIERIREQPAQQMAIWDYVLNHGGRLPDEAVSGVLSIPEKVVVVGRMLAIAYRADKGNGKRRSNYRHVFSNELPFLAVNPLGKRLTVIGGNYTLEDGWLHG